MPQYTQGIKKKRDLQAADAGALSKKTSSPSKRAALRHGGFESEFKKVPYLGGQNQGQREKQEGDQDGDEVFPAGQHCLPGESHGAGAGPVLNSLESALGAYINTREY